MIFTTGFAYGELPPVDRTDEAIRCIDDMCYYDLGEKTLNGINIKFLQLEQTSRFEWEAEGCQGVQIAPDGTILKKYRLDDCQLQFSATDSFGNTKNIGMITIQNSVKNYGPLFTYLQDGKYRIEAKQLGFRDKDAPRVAWFVTIINSAKSNDYNSALEKNPLTEKNLPDPSWYEETSDDFIIRTQESTNSSVSIINEQPYLLIIIPIIVISIIAVIIKSKKSRGSTRTQTGSSYTSSSKKQKTSKKTSSGYSSSPDYFRWTNCCGCGQKFSRFNMKKTTSDSYENVPAGEYICNRCSSIYRKVDRINKGIYKESTLRDFRQRQEYITLEHNSRREKVTTDEEFDELISELEFGARDEWEFSTLEKLILDSILLEFYQRKQAHTRTDEQSEQKQRPGNDEYIKSLEILGLSKDSTFDEIKKRHKELVLVHHPDRNPDPERKKFAEHMMKEINKAMDVIRRIREK